MASLCWMSVLLILILSSGDSLAVDQNRLAVFVNDILERYGVQGMFSLAVSIPDNLNLQPAQVLQQVFSSDPGNNVKNKMNNDEVYIGSRVVGAKFLKMNKSTEHAESRVVDYLSRLSNNRNDLLLFYVYASPCVEKCSNDTHRRRILERIRLISQWANRAFVFSKIFKPQHGPTNTDEERREALQRLANQGSVGLNNIFRCDSAWGPKSCTSCYSEGQVANYCVSAAGLNRDL